MRPMWHVKNPLRLSLFFAIWVTLIREAECGVSLKLPLGLERDAPTGHSVTQYDRAHFQDYVRLLDAVAKGLGSDEMCKTILQIDPVDDRAEAHKILRSHIRRAQWMTRTGYRRI